MIRLCGARRWWRRSRRELFTIAAAATTARRFPRQVNELIDFPTAVRHSRRPGKRRTRTRKESEEALLSLLAHRSSGTGRATSTSRASCASCTPTSGVDWLEQEPSRDCRCHRERVHQLSARLASERDIELESGETTSTHQGHPAHGRGLIANHMIFQDAVTGRLRPRDRG